MKIAIVNNNNWQKERQNRNNEYVLRAYGIAGACHASMW